MLLQHDPDQRPDTLFLLKSDLLPARIEEEMLKEAIKTIANPDQGTDYFLKFILNLMKLIELCRAHIFSTSR
jgi:hypothetical protein